VKQITPGAPAHKPSPHPQAATATVTDVIRPPLATVGQYDHVAAAAYLMKHTGTTALRVVNAQTSQPAGIITEADIDRAIADGKDINDVRVHAVMTRPPGRQRQLKDPRDAQRHDSQASPSPARRRRAAMRPAGAQA
jgi:hypothetical protein